MVYLCTKWVRYFCQYKGWVNHIQMDSMDSKHEFILNTVIQLRNVLSNHELKESLKKICDTIWHAAPEIIDQQWKRIFDFCKNNITDSANEEHKLCYEIYHTRYQEYLKLYHKSL